MAKLRKKKPAATDPDATITNWDQETVQRARGLKVLVLGGAFFGSIVRMMAVAGYSKAKDVDDADLVVFAGGSDIDPALYGEEPIQQCGSPDYARDKYEQEIYHRCVKNGTPMFGICRGAQFLWAMNGGSLWQHVTNHAGGNHWIIDLEEDKRVLANSYHHQAMAWEPTLGANLIAICEDNVSDRFLSQELSVHLSARQLKNGFDGELEVEAASFDKTKCFLVQGHPEAGNVKYQSWCLTKLIEHLEDWMDAETYADYLEEERVKYEKENSVERARKFLDQING